ncbi:uncharacterized protein STEHIDRAFT_70825 [Stereum hirsutum FP-91666 SS1]|uniref:uncharacterized protein n=1 Tax=Stereum hirsutum (strain FP-91666) TaxID=721885 RepID=UPI000440BE3E|nr:uncharacterized protein STEHIDRAFT_70825 [Stereum hirsutum FP-91666 SS1]EIM92219.1 hypothetical protein STEHIDRAFT_70825 [Stereum hirsutum FP-91666 SS1]
MVSRPSLQYTSRFAATCGKLFEGLKPSQISPRDNELSFWSNFLALDVDRPFLVAKISNLPKEECLDGHKPVINNLFELCVQQLKTAPCDDARKLHAVEILSVLTRTLLTKPDMAGWEVMEMFAGGVNGSDEFFMKFVTTIDQILGDTTAPADIRHQVLQLAIIFMCGVNQLSPGAYFLRIDLFPSTVSVVLDPATERYAFEALLLLALLANFHKSDAAKLNPYLTRITDTNDQDLMRKVCWVANFAIVTTIKAYQEISDDSPPTMVTALGAFMTSLRPDRALASTPVDPPRELFKNKPIEACVVLLSIYEFMHTNTSFTRVLSDSLKQEPSNTNKTRKLEPVPCTLISLSSYLVTHATSLSSARAIAYANLSLNILFTMVEADELIFMLCQTAIVPIRLCRQRLPVLPSLSSSSPPVCSLLDCCVLCLRHNLHMRLELSLLLTSVWICRRALWFLHREHIRLEYHWQELWRALFGLLDFLANKMDSLITAGDIIGLVEETITLLDLAFVKAEIILPTPRAVHEFIYEIVRSSAVLRKCEVTLHSASALNSRAPSAENYASSVALSRLLSVANFYEEKISSAQARTAKEAMRVVAKHIDQDGLFGVGDGEIEEPPLRSRDMVIFLRQVYEDGMALMP